MASSALKLVRSHQSGFTLIELIVVISIIGILAAIVVPAVSQHIGVSQEKSYAEELSRIQGVVDQYYLSSKNPKFQGMRQYPIRGASKAGGTLYTGDPNETHDVIDGGIEGNPLEGVNGGTPVWIDDGDGSRDETEDVLNDEDSDGTEVGWHVAAVTVKVNGSDVTYYVDSRDYFIDFDLLVTGGRDSLLRKYPESASRDNCFSCDGSYIYYVDSTGTVGTLLSHLPTKAGFQDSVFP